MTAKIVPSKDLTYLGAFKLPSPGSGWSWLCSDGGGNAYTGLEYCPTDSTLIVMANEASTSRYITKVNLDAAIVNSKTLGDLNTATLAHSPVDITNGLQGGYTVLGDVLYVPAHEDRGIVANAKLYWCTYVSYSGGVYKLGWAENNLDALGIAGNWNVSGMTGSVLKYMMLAPQAWAELHTAGRSLVTGYRRNGGSSLNGPDLLAIAPWLDPDGDPVYDEESPPPDDTSFPYNSLLKYGALNPLNLSQAQTDASPNDMFNSVRWLSVAAKQAVVFCGHHSLRTYATADTGYTLDTDPSTSNGGGYFCYPTIPCLWFYSVDDLTNVVDDPITYPPYGPQCYARVELLNYAIDSAHRFMGMAYDQANQKIYIQEYIAASNVIHVFQLADSGITTLDTTPPGTPAITLTSATPTSHVIAWDAVTDSGGKPVDYRFYVNEHPIAIQITTGFTHNYASYYPCPVSYRVDAVDFDGNVAASNVLTVTEDDGGSAPIQIYVKTMGSSTEHVNSSLFFKYDEDISVPVYVKGGTPPYTWTFTTAPTGVVIDGDPVNDTVHYITGHPSVLDQANYGGRLVVVDDDGNTSSRKVSWKVVNSTTSGYANRWYDQDGDGVGSQVGDVTVSGIVLPGGDSGSYDDYNCESTPNTSYSQPTPSSLAMSWASATEVTLVWPKAADRTDNLHTRAVGAPYYAGRYAQIGLNSHICYEVYHGTETGVYTDSVFVGRGRPDAVLGEGYRTYTYTGLGAGTHYFAVKAIEHHGLASAYTEEKYGTALTANGQCYGTYHSEGADEYCKIAETSDGGAVLASWSSGYAWITVPGEEARRIMVVKVNASGVEQWRRIIGPDTSGTVSYNITGKIRNADTHWMSTGVFVSGTDIYVYGYRDIGKSLAPPFLDGFLIKLNSSGTLVWDTAINGAGNSNDWLFDGIVDGSGGSVLVGQTFHTAANYGWFVMLNSSGTVTKKTECNTNYKGTLTKFRAIRALAGGGYVCAGSTATNTNETDNEYYVAKFDASGDVVWAYKYGLVDRVSKCLSVEEDASGYIWLFGRSSVSGNTKMWIKKLNSNGTAADDGDFYIGNDTAGHHYMCRHSLKMANGNFLVIGYKEISSVFSGYVAEVSSSTGAVVGTATSVRASDDTVDCYLMHGIVSSGADEYWLVGTDNGGFSTYYDLWFLKLAVADMSVQNTTSDVKITYYYDKDLDGLGNNNQWSPATGDALVQMPGYVLNHSDADDGYGAFGAPRNLRIVR